MSDKKLTRRTMETNIRIAEDVEKYNTNTIEVMIDEEGDEEKFAKKKKNTLSKYVNSTHVSFDV